MKAGQKKLKNFVTPCSSCVFYEERERSYLGNDHYYCKKWGYFAKGPSDSRCDYYTPKEDKP